MNREVIFRGKDAEGGEWLYGSHFTDCGEDYIIPQTLLDIKDYEDFQVDQNTVGEFTGLCDKNGVKVFEGDIVGFGKGRYVCEFVEGGFQFKDLDDGRLTLNAIAIKSKVIGNIYDNPELLNKK